MIGSRFLWKLYGGFVALIILTTFVAGYFASRRLERDSLAEVETSLGRIATLVEEQEWFHPGRLEDSSEELRERLDELARILGARLTLILADGRVLADSETQDLAPVENLAGRPEIARARREGERVIEMRPSGTAGAQHLFLADPIFRDGRLAGFIRVAQGIDLIEKRIGRLRMSLALGGVIAAFIALLVGFIFARRVTRPLRSMTEASVSLARGKYDTRIAVSSNDEFGTLARSFNSMSENLRERVDTISTDRNKLLAILAGMVEGVVAVDLASRVLHINEAASRILDVDTEETTGRPIWELTRVRDISTILSETMEEGIVLQERISPAGIPGDQTVEVYSSPLRDGRGVLVGAVAVLHDITELRRLEGIRQDFVANVSHELKTPLTAIRGFVETLIDDEAMEPATHTRFLHRIRTQAQRLSALVNDLLVLSRVESEAYHKEATITDLCDPTRQAVRDLRETAEQKGIQIRLSCPPERVPVEGDEEAFRQVLENLIGNAVRYTPEGGRIDVTVGVAASLDESRREWAAVEVRDTGIGIERKHHQRIFERFYRVDKARSRELGGTGLGLAIVKHIVLAHGGDVSVESVPGRGSTFRVRLPLVKQPKTTNVHPSLA